jgi:hypothetical protein
VTQSKKNTSGTWPSQLPAAKNLVLPCNSFYREDLESQVSQIQDQFKSINIELHFQTLALERNQEKLARLAEKNYSWLVHIDHLDQPQIKKLKAWDKYVLEYRVLPSKLYPAATYLRDLPDFVQKKMKWLFATKEGVTNDFADIEEIPAIVESLKNSPLHGFATASTQWAHTVAGETPVFVTGEGWSSLNATSYDDENWPLFLAQANSSYLGFMVDPNVDLLNEVVQKNKSSVIYVETPAHKKLLKALQPQSSTATPFYFLENFLVRKEIWQVYLRTYTSYNHWTWSHFIKHENIQLSYCEAAANTPVASKLKVPTLRRQSQQRYLQTLDQNFYSQYFYFIHENGLFRKSTFALFSLFFSLKYLFPRSLRERLTQMRSYLRRRAEDVAYSLEMTGEAARKVALFLFNKSFWATHAKYWESYAVANRTFGFFYALSIKFYWRFGFRTYRALRGTFHFIYWRVLRQAASGIYASSVQTFWFGYKVVMAMFTGLNYIFWRLCDGFWACYHGIWIAYSYTLAPVIGFIVSLFDFPESYAQAPWPERWKLKSIFIAKKWGWLLFKTVGLR